VKFLLDENFPLAFYRRLRDAGKDVEHVIALGQRGVHDDVLRQRLAAETLVFLRSCAGTSLTSLVVDGGWTAQ